MVQGGTMKVRGLDPIDEFSSLHVLTKNICLHTVLEGHDKFKILYKVWCWRSLL